MNMRLFGTAILIMYLCSSVTLAIAPLGTPTSEIETGRWSIGADYSRSEIDLRLEDAQGTSFFTVNKAEKVRFDLVLGKIGYGICENWDVFVGLGASKAKYKNVNSYMDAGSFEQELVDYESDTGFVTEVGTKTTFYEKDNLKIGGMVQLSWLNLDGTYKEASWTDGVFNDSGEGDLDADIIVVQAAPGLSYQLYENLSVYGGPFWQWIDGDGKADGKTGSASGEGGKGDIKEDSSFGGWVGLKAELYKNLTCNVEFQATCSSNTLGIGIAAKF